MLLMTSSPIKNELVHNYVDNGPINIPTKFQSTTPNNKEVTEVADSPLPPPPPLPPTANVASKIARPG